MYLIKKLISTPTQSFWIFCTQDKERFDIPIGTQVQLHQQFIYTGRDLTGCRYEFTHPAGIALTKKQDGKIKYYKTVTPLPIREDAPILLKQTPGETFYVFISKECIEGKEDRFTDKKELKSIKEFLSSGSTYIELKNESIRSIRVESTKIRDFTLNDGTVELVNGTKRKSITSGAAAILL